MVQRFLRFCFLTTAILGALFVTYGTVSSWTGESWRPVETIASALSSALTILGTMVTAASIYLFPAEATRLPDDISREFTAPFVILAALIALVVLAANGSLPIMVVNGFALIAIGGGLLRAQPRPPGW